jgi:hypothetical protein
VLIHLGGGEVLDEDEIVGIFDLDTASASRITREFLEAREAAGELRTQGTGLPRYFTVTRSDTVYLSQSSGKPVI